MKTYKLKTNYRCHLIKIGDVVEVDDEYVVVVAIIKVDFNKETIWFNGLKADELE